MIDQSALFFRIDLGNIILRNRVVMAPLTRSRAGKHDVPGPLNAEYYAQRASAGLIISEATNITQQGKGYAFTPGIYTQAQVYGWHSVTQAVHAAGGRIFCQLWHVGRISHPTLQPDGGLPVAPSAVKPIGQAYTESGFAPLVTPRALETSEIPGLIADYVHAAESAKAAGFDGVEVHAANGYLLEQFMRRKTNLRTDNYGGSIENRARLTLEVTRAVAQVWGGDQVGIRLSPVSPANDMEGAADDAQALYEHVANGIDHLKLGYMHIIEGATQGPRDNIAFDYAALKAKFRGLYMANNGYDLQLAVTALASGRADLIAFGRAFITNPDLVERLRSGSPLAPSIDTSLWYGGGAHGYTDYPTTIATAA
ncbi:alkene reductase [Acidisoma cladoniae]|jgi:N-ethylmaleimide reductase|uniref:alkene reductase n=1 Tax=Acidisoma cladoniae TaxID=3040935 RepID=UPI00254E1D3A|nr:alkene reductase [Acidisoma sp. PAMC 29798]